MFKCFFQSYSLLWPVLQHPLHEIEQLVVFCTVTSHVGPQGSALVLHSFSVLRAFIPIQFATSKVLALRSHRRRNFAQHPFHHGQMFEGIMCLKNESGWIRTLAKMKTNMSDIYLEESISMVELKQYAADAPHVAGERPSHIWNQVLQL